MNKSWIKCFIIYFLKNNCTAPKLLKGNVSHFNGNSIYFLFYFSQANVVPKQAKSFCNLIEKHSIIPVLWLHSGFSIAQLFHTQKILCFKYLANNFILLDSLLVLKYQKSEIKMFTWNLIHRGSGRSYTSFFKDIE